LLGRAFSWIPYGDVASRANLMSAFFASATVATIFLAARTLALSSIPRVRRPTKQTKESGVAASPQQEREELDCSGKGASLVATIGAFSFAFSPTFWSQSTIAEVYTLGAFLAAAMLCLVTRMASRVAASDTRSIFALGLAAGLGMANHLTIVLWLAATALWLLLLNPDWMRQPKSVARLAAGFMLGLSLYLFLPLRAAAHPAANWGNPSGLTSFLWVVTAGPYRHLAFKLPYRDVLRRIPTMVAFLRQQFGWGGIALGLGGVWVVSEVNRRFLAFSVAAFLGTAISAISYNSVDSFVYLIPAYLVFSLWITIGAGSVLQSARAWSRGHHWSLPAAAMLLVILVPVSSLFLNYSTVDASDDREAYDFAASAFSRAAGDAILLVEGDEQTFALWYYRDCVGERPDVAVLNRNLLGSAWYEREAQILYPSISWPESLSGGDPVELIIAANSARRPIYLADGDPGLMDRFRFVPDGALFRLETQQ
jgi:hypothetical protein